MSVRSFALVSILIPIIFLSGCINLNFLKPPTPSGEKVSFMTSDGVNIVGSYYDGGNNSVILLHMLGRTRADYNDFAKFLQDKGYTVLSIDFRGHGESSTSQLTAPDFTKLVYDAASAKNFLVSRGKPADRVSIVGASIGANIALRYAASDSSIRSVVLISPGFDYRGVTTMDVISYYNGRLLMIATEEDSNAASTVRALSTSSPQAEVKIYPTGGHGTDMFATNPDVKNLIADFLQKVYS